MDIGHTYEKQYLEFNPSKFLPADIEAMNLDIEKAERRMVVIADPHIHKSDRYRVFEQGTFFEDEFHSMNTSINVFVDLFEDFICILILSGSPKKWLPIKRIFYTFSVKFVE